MNSTIIGLYDTQQEVISAIQNLQQEGYKVQELGLIALTRNTDSFIKNETGANTLTFDNTVAHEANTDGDNDGLVEKLTHLYDNNQIETTYNKFRELGMSHEQADEYATYVKNGKIVLYNENIEVGSNTTLAGYNIAPETQTEVGLSSDTQDQMETPSNRQLILDNKSEKNSR